MEQLILIGEIAKYFENNKPNLPISGAKFIIISTKGVDLKMIIHLTGDYTFHAEAVKKFMDDNSYSEIYCYGGGKVTFQTHQNIFFYDKSYSFGSPITENILSVGSAIWPGYDLEIMTSGTRIKEGRVYDRERIQYLIDNA